MRGKTILAAGVAMMISGCNQEPVPNPPVTEARTTEPAGPEIASLPEGQRNAVFLRAIRDDHRECQRVERSMPRDAVNGSPAWAATCEGGTEWIVIPFGDGQAQVLSPNELQAAGEGNGVASDAKP